MSTSTKSSPPAEPPTKVEKRRANTLAARRYRQKRVDQMSGLEAELKEVKAERDEWKQNGDEDLRVHGCKMVRCGDSEGLRSIETLVLIIIFDIDASRRQPLNTLCVDRTTPRQGQHAPISRDGSAK
ncbi:hypothetical protein B5807_07246 [Epicoccum nigrum]|uniref:BZIP domain-containing protein n=1 Tax=Epicoccum nigrum TaxID=105696 RepID=A0A1Y2LVF7_EPING|nr:hypothetical protein B5807_07246 [Epicoccum nigrum]